MRGTLGVRIVTPTQDRHVTKHVTGLSYESSAPGGGTTASMTLRMTRDTWPDIVGARLFIYDAATAEAMWDGWIDNPGESSTDDTESFELSAQGPSTLAQDKSRALWYIDTGFENFTDKYVYDVGTRIQGASESVGDLPSLTPTTDTDTETEQPQAVVAQIPSGTIISHPYFCGMRWAGADGTEMRIRAYSFRTKNGFTDSNYRTRVTGFGGVDDVTASTTERVQRQVTPRSFVTAALYLRRHAGGATTIPNDNYWGAFWEPLIKAELVNRWGQPVVPTLDRYWKLTAIVEDLAGRMISGLDPALVTIEDTPYEVDQLMYKDGTRAAAVLDDLLKWEPNYTWTIDTTGSPLWGRGFHWFKNDTSGVPRYEITADDGVEFPGGDNDVATEAVVFWEDPTSGDRRRRTTIKTADPLSPAWEYSGGRTRTADPITLDEGKASAKNAERAAEIVLETHQAPTRSGTATVARPVRDLQTGRPIQPWQLPLRVGGLFRVRETGEVLPLTSATYDDDDRSASLTLGRPAEDLEDLLAAIPDTTT